MPTEGRAPTDDVVLRPGAAEDLPAVAELFLAARAAAAGHLPPVVHPAEETRARVRGWDLAAHELWVATDPDGRLLGFALLTEAWLDHLYVAPASQRAGVGSALLEVAQAARPGGFCLWVFESNAPARSFYARHGLVELERTDGSANDERAPDVRVAWPGAEPLRFLRGLIDEVDDQLGDLLARRVALTRVVQQHKAAAGRSAAGGVPRRDAEREQVIARRLAARAPELGERRLQRLVDVLVAESLAAVSGQVATDGGVSPPPATIEDRGRVG